MEYHVRQQKAQEAVAQRKAQEAVAQRQKSKRTRSGPRDDKTSGDEWRKTKNDSPVTQYPPYATLLGSVPVLLYAALYITDAVLLYWTFVPGYYREVFALTNFAIFDAKAWAGPDGIKFVDAHSVLRYTAATWRFLFGQHYVPGRSFRYIDDLVVLSLRLEVYALSSALGFVAVCMWFRGWPGRVERTRQWSAFALLEPWTAWAVYRLTRAAVLPVEDLDGGRAAALAVPVFVWVVFHSAGKTSAFRAAQLPPSCQWQLALSVYRLSHSLLDPYQHQVGPAIAATQLALLDDMLFLVWGRFLLPHVGRIIRAGYSALEAAVDNAGRKVEALLRN